MATHEFGIIEDIMYGVDYIYYEPEEYDCISVNDDLVEQIISSFINEFKFLKTYAHDTTRPIYGLNYCGITLIPPESLEAFHKIITDANICFKSQELEFLIEKISVANIEKKFLIHFGI